MKIHSNIEAEALVNKCIRVVCSSNKLQLPAALKYLVLAKTCLKKQGYNYLAAYLEDVAFLAGEAWPPSS